MRSKYNYKTYSIRLKLDDPQQAKIANILENLNKVVHKSVNQFVVDSIEFYMQHFTEAQLIKSKGEHHSDTEYVTEERLQRVLSDRDSRIPEIVCEQLIRMIGNNMVLANMIGATPVNVTASEQKPIINDETEGETIIEDEALLDDVMKWS